MTITAAATTTHYQKIGSGPYFFLLHGWGCDWQIWSPLIPFLSDHFTLIIPDLPAFGQSGVPTKVWDTPAYVHWLDAFIQTQCDPKKDTWYLMGHSFGGKLGAVYAATSNHPPTKLIICDASGLPDPLPTRLQWQKQVLSYLPAGLKQAIPENIKAQFLKVTKSSTDYAQANTYQKRVFLHVVKENIAAELPNISIPTQVIWGALDTDTPLHQGNQFAKLIPKAQLHVASRSGHFPFITEPAQSLVWIGNFLGVTFDSAVGLAQIPQNQLSALFPVSAPTESATTHTQVRLSLLTILQQAEYEFSPLKQWLHRHQTIPQLQPQQWTLKAQVIWYISTLFSFLPPLTALKIATTIWQPIDFGSKWFLVHLATAKLRYLQNQGLTVIAVMGSYGKTSTKHILGQALAENTTTLWTPKSINTPIGIAQTILKQARRDHRVFIVELGEYRPGDLEQLLAFTKPNLGILTPIGRQHLDKMSGESKLVTTFQAPFQYFSSHPDSLLVHESASAWFPNHPHPIYGTTKSADYRPEKISVTWQGIEFTACIPSEKILDVTFPWLGEHQAVNVLPSFWVATQCHLSTDAVRKALAWTPQLDRRHQPWFITPNITIIDNSYNTNPDSWKSSKLLLEKLPNKHRFVVTLGFTDQGEAARTAHYQLGKELHQVANAIALVSSPNTPAIISGYTDAGGKAETYCTAATLGSALQALAPKVPANSSILIEGGYQELYV